jgi:2-polyprenyl-6-methoxyphenol hydroxylase-like FAD-dependent oxidoreductase
MTMMTDGFDALFSNHSKVLEKLRERGMQWVERSTGLKSLFVENAVGV